MGESKKVLTVGSRGSHCKQCKGYKAIDMKYYSTDIHGYRNGQKRTVASTIVKTPSGIRIQRMVRLRLNIAYVRAPQTTAGIV